MLLFFIGIFMHFLLLPIYTRFVIAHLPTFLLLPFAHFLLLPFAHFFVTASRLPTFAHFCYGPFLPTFCYCQPFSFAHFLLLPTNFRLPF